MKGGDDVPVEFPPEVVKVVEANKPGPQYVEAGRLQSDLYYVQLWSLSALANLSGAMLPALVGVCIGAAHWAPAGVGLPPLTALSDALERAGLRGAMVSVSFVVGDGGGRVPVRFVVPSAAVRVERPPLDVLQ